MAGLGVCQASLYLAEAALDILGVMKLLPHRPPFLFVDRVVECLDGERITAVKNVTSSEERVLSCPFVVIEALAQVAVILAKRSMGDQRREGDLFFFAGIQSAHFFSVPRRGEQLLLVAELEQIRRGIGWFRGTAEADGRKVVSVMMQAAVRPVR